MVAVNIKGDVKKHVKALRGLDRKVIRPAVNSSLNKTATKTRSFLVKEISKNSGVVQKKIRPQLRIIKSNFKKLRATVVVSDSGMSLYKWTGGAAPKRKELAAAVAPSPVVGKYFRATMTKNRHTGFFKRQPKKRIQKNKKSAGGHYYKSSAISELYINPVAKGYMKGQLKQKVDQMMEREFNVILPREINWRLTKQGMQ